MLFGSPQNSPKMALCLSRALQGKLLTKEFLKSVGQWRVCVLCNTTQESIQHLFVSCPFSSYLWSLCRLKLGLAGSPGTLYEEASLIQPKFHAKCKSTILAKNTIAAAVWHVWKEWNLRIFRLQSSHKIMVFRMLYEDIRLLLRTCNWKV